MVSEISCWFQICSLTNLAIIIWDYCYIITLLKERNNHKNKLKKWKNTTWYITRDVRISKTNLVPNEMKSDRILQNEKKMSKQKVQI